MGDYAVIWTNERLMAWNLYIVPGNHPKPFQNLALDTIFHNSISWAAHQ
jgi:hypothetical protein